MTNPNDAVGTNAAYGGRTSANAFNDDLAMYSVGVVSGWACAPDSGMTVSLGGNGTVRDVAIAEDNAGNKTTINNISGSPINVTLDAAPASNSRIDLVVAYVDNPPQGTSTVADNPSACGIIPITGTPASTPIAPNDSDIRTAITADGASGTTAYYVVLAQITVVNGTTDVVAGDIEAGAKSQLKVSNIEIAPVPYKTYGISDLTKVSGPTTTISSANLNLWKNAEGTVAKFWGGVFLTSSSTSGDVTYRVDSDCGLRPASDMNINYHGLTVSRVSGGSVGNLLSVQVVIKTTGELQVVIPKEADRQMIVRLFDATIFI